MSKFPVKPVLSSTVRPSRRESSGTKSPIGWLTGIHDIDLDSLNIDHKCVAELLGVDHGEWEKELQAHRDFFDSLDGVVPQELQNQREQLVARFKG